MNSDILSSVRDFADRELRPFAGLFDARGALPEDLIRKLGQGRWLGCNLPKEYGGLGLDQLTYGYITEEIGKACCATRSLLTVHSSLVGESILRFGTAEQKRKWLPRMACGETIAAFALSEPETGSDAAGVRTVYERKGHSAMINGKKKWITFGARADLFLAIAGGKDGVTAFLVEKSSPGLGIVPMEGMLAGRAAGMAEITFDGVTVKEEAVLGRWGNGFSYIVNTALDHGRYSVAWAGLAIAQESLEVMVTYARQRKQFGKYLHEFQLIQAIIGDAVAHVHAARSLCIRAGMARDANTTDAEAETSIAKYFTSRAAVKISSDALQIHGGNGCHHAFSPERLFREARVLEIIEGSSQIQQLQIGGFGLRKYYRKQGIAVATVDK